MQAPMAQGLKTLERIRRGFAPTAREFAPTTDDEKVQGGQVLAFGTPSLKPRCLHSEQEVCEVLACGTP